MCESKSRRSDHVEKVKQEGCSFISPPKGSDFSEQKDNKLRDLLLEDLETEMRRQFSMKH